MSPSPSPNLDKVLTLNDWDDSVNWFCLDTPSYVCSAVCRDKPLAQWPFSFPCVQPPEPCWHGVSAGAGAGNQMKVSPEEEYFVLIWIAPRVWLWCVDTQRGTSAQQRGQQDPAQGQECTAEAGVGNRTWSKKTRDQHCARNISLCAQLLSAHPIPYRRDNWERGRRGESRNSPLTFQRTSHAAGVATPRKYGCSFAGIVFGGSDLMAQSGYAPSVVLVQLFVLLCCQTHQETALKKQHPPLLSYFYPGSVPRHNSPCLHWGATGGRALEWESVARSRRTEVCLNPLCPSKNTHGPTPWGEFTLQQSQPACLSEFERSKRRKGRLNPCRHVQHLHAIFLWKT